MMIHLSQDVRFSNGATATALTLVDPPTLVENLELFLVLVYMEITEYMATDPEV